MIQYQPVSKPEPQLPQAMSCSRALTERMADDMREMAFAGQNVSPETLVQRGWTVPTIKRLSQAAVQQARRESVRQLK